MDGRFLIEDFFPDGPGDSQTETGFWVVEFGPEDPWRIQQFQSLSQDHPLGSPRHPRLILGCSFVLSQETVDQGGFSHIGDAYDHHPDRTVPDPLLPPFFQGRFSRFLDGADEGFDPFALLAVHFQGRETVFLEISQPVPGPVRIGHIRFVQDHDFLLAADQLLEHRIGTGSGNPGIQEFYHHIHQFQVGFHHPFGLGHVAGEPLDMEFLSADCIFHGNFLSIRKTGTSVPGLFA